MEKVLVIGKGGREAALVDAFLRAPSVAEVHAAPGSAFLARRVPCHPIPEDDADALLALIEEVGISLTVIGPEVPLAAGVVDRLQAAGMKVFGPSQAAARIESSKAFAKALMQRAGVPTAAYRVYTDAKSLRRFIEEENTAYPIVFKENGLRAGKGVALPASREEALHWIEGVEINEEQPIVVEDFLSGFECSLIVLAHGEDFIALPAAQDHKPLLDGGKGPNTGGMGAVSPVPRLSDASYREAIDQVIRPTLHAMAREGTPFTGFLYAGLMVTARGVRVIEFNARFGDPEAEVLLPRLQSDLAALILGLLDGRPQPAKIAPEACVGVVLSAPGYPGPSTSQPLLPQALVESQQDDIQLLHMGTKQNPDGSWQAAGGRVLLVSALAPNIEAARKAVYRYLEALPQMDFHYRRDIGDGAL